MKTAFKSLIFFMALNMCLVAQNNPSPSTTSSNMKQVLIDKLMVPASSNDEFIQRVTINRNILKQIPGFIKDEVFVRPEENGDLVYITVAQWENADALKEAKKLVDAEYKKTGFNVQEFCQKWDIKIERAIYQSKED